MTQKMKIPIVAAVILNSSRPILSQRYEDFFPPSEEEYDPLLFDPNSLFGAPLGGYARATRSRLAALPLRLVGGSVFWGTDADSDQDHQDGDKHEIDGTSGSGGGDSEEEYGSQMDSTVTATAKAVNDAPYFTMRDGTGRQFACRIYNEDELTSESISQSMFTKAIEVDRSSKNYVNGGQGQGQGQGDTNSGSSDALAQINSQGGYHDDKAEGEDNDTSDSSPFRKSMANGEEVNSNRDNVVAGSDDNNIEIEIVFADMNSAEDDDFHDDDDDDNLNFDDDEEEYESVLEKIAKAQKDLLKADDITLTNIQTDVDVKLIAGALNKLKDRCAQLHSGWWSYEWCHESQVKQFHIQMQSNTMDDVVSVHDLMPEFVVQSISTVGTYQKRKIVVKVSDPKFYTDHRNDDDDDDDTTVVEDTETGTGSDSAIDDRNGGTGKDMEVDLKLESITVVETYVDGEYCEEIKAERSVEVHLKCCSDSEVQTYLQMENEGMNTMKSANTFSLESSEEPLAILLSVQEESVCSYTATVCTNVLCDNWLYDDDEKFDPLTGDNAPDNALSKRGVEFHKDDSIRYILDSTLEETCLRRNEGWWTFSYCHKSIAYQYHEKADIDFAKGTVKKSIEAKNILGKYQAQNDDFPDEYEVKYIVFPNGDDETSSTQGQNVGVSSPYYTQEFHHGDICEGEDVIDSAIKGGNVIEGGVGVERSSIIRFFCGNQRELVRVDEDHTCHYIIDITVPELCVHKYFEVPHIKKHAVKCLPVD